MLSLSLAKTAQAPRFSRFIYASDILTKVNRSKGEEE